LANSSIASGQPRGSPHTNLLFAGQYTDPNTGLICMQARWYDPGTGQFMSVDPDETQTQAIYYYAGDDPVTGSDPSGDFAAGVGPPPGALATVEERELYIWTYFINAYGEFSVLRSIGW